MSPAAGDPALDRSLRADAALAALDDALIDAARRLQRLGFTPSRISAAQLAAAGEAILGAASFDKARQALGRWLRHQLERLEARVRRGSPPTSWLLPPTAGDAAAASLGEELLRWIEHDLYLPAPISADLDRLAALQRFWGRFAGLYRYQAAVGSPMALTTLTTLAEAAPGGEHTEGLTT